MAVAKCSATKGERIAGAGWYDTHRETAGNGIELICEGNRAADKVARDGIIETDGPIVVVNGVGDFVGFALGLGV